MKQLTKEQYLPIVRKILGLRIVEQLQKDGSIMQFLSSIWEMRTMPSMDNRYNNLYDDIQKHWVDNNEDYDDDNLFFTRLRLLEDGTKLK